jgi:hypothetical protein
MIDKKITYTTSDEIDFIKSLGSFSLEKMKYRKSIDERIKLLENYKKALELRQKWGNISKYDVLDFLDSYIFNLKKEKLIKEVV